MTLPTHDQYPAQGGILQQEISRRGLLTLAGLMATALALDACAPGGSDARPASPPIDADPSATPPVEATKTPAQVTPESRFAPTPTWEQDFTKIPNGKLDARWWNIDTGTEIPSYNDEAQTLTDDPKNVRIDGGKLVLEARKERRDGKEYTSAHVNTQGKFGFQYGKLEVELKVPKGVGTWPAAWLLPEGAKYDPAQWGVPAEPGGWPFQGEIDFFESVGADPGHVYPDLHTYNSEKAKENGTVHVDLPDDTERYHTFGVEKTPEGITFTCDGKAYQTIKKPTGDLDPRAWPFDQPYYLILNLAMGGDWGGDARDKFPPDGIEGDGPWEMDVKRVRFFELAA